MCVIIIYANTLSRPTVPRNNKIDVKKMANFEEIETTSMLSSCAIIVQGRTGSCHS